MEERQARFLMKNATKAAHEALESLACHRKLFSPEFTSTDYISLLSAYYRVLCPYDEKLAGINWQGAPEYVPRVPSLKHDLMLLNGSLPKLTPIIENMEKAEWLGIRYVIEGMSLGGKVILANAYFFKNQPDLAAVQFYSQSTHCWPKFCAVLSRELTNSVDIHKASQAANRVLNEMIDSLRHESFEREETA